MLLNSLQFFSSSQAIVAGRTQSAMAPCTASTSPPSSKRFSCSLSRRVVPIILASSFTSSSSIQFLSQSPFAKAEVTDEFEEEEERVVRIFQEASPAVVCIKDLELQSRTSGLSEGGEEDLSDAKVEGTGSGFVWDKSGHIVTNYHVVDKLVTDTSGRHRCRVFLEDSEGKLFSREGKLVGYDPAYDLAVLKRQVDIEGDKLKPAAIGLSRNLRVGQSCFAIGNPYAYEHTLTTGVVSGLRRQIPSPNGKAIRGAIQTDAAINAGNSGGPLIDSYGHVIGVNTATFTRKGSGTSSGVNFAIPIDVVVRIVPSLIVNGTDFKDRFSF
ncbi:hypothetical protein HPP92_015669 [Vanilla planifolia]|uniref:Protease Do-like 5, chloroplastic n=1 Tax=Vanilla planifolia TaxID=51239 RepID=A0A835UTW6_VANPL|nr:hypothetical protein HPP92_015669 [Vanilla planifolia]